MLSGVSLAVEHYFWSDGDRVEPNMSEVRITAKPDPTVFSSWGDLYSIESALNEVVEPMLMADSFWMLTVNIGYSVDSLLSRLRGRPDILFANPVLLDESEREIYMTDQLVVLYKSETSVETIESIRGTHALEIVDTLFRDFRFQLMRITTSSSGNVLSIANEIYELGVAKVARASFILPFEPLGDPDDEYWHYQWHFKNTGQFGGVADADIDLELAREYTMPDTSLLVAVVDDGCAPHEDLAAERLAGGYDYVFDNWDETPWEFDNHGMMIAGIIAATTDNGIGLAGVAGNDVRVLNQKIFHSWGWVGDGEVAKAIDDAVDSGAVVISFAFGYVVEPHWRPVIDAALTRADSLGAVLVAASGNLGGPLVIFPANHPKMIAVGATDSTDQRWWYSSYGLHLDVVAPSGFRSDGHLWSLDQMGALGWNDGSMDCLTLDMDYLCTGGGTSAAAPQVTGIAALIMQRRPDIIGNTERVRQIIRYSSERAQYGGSDTSRVNYEIGWGREC